MRSKLSLGARAAMQRKPGSLLLPVLLLHDDYTCTCRQQGFTTLEHSNGLLHTMFAIIKSSEIRLRDLNNPRCHPAGLLGPSIHPEAAPIQLSLCHEHEMQIKDRARATLTAAGSHFPDYAGSAGEARPHC